MKLLLDTDIGNDIDDAVALAYLLEKKECDLVGITTVTGEAQKRAALCEIVCRASGRENIPIHCGLENALANGPGQPTPHHYEAVKHLPHRLDRPENTAVDFLRETIRANPNEITLLSIGPLTNIAALFAIDSEIPFLLKEFVSMAGAFFPPIDYAEWNIKCDPVAAAIVYAAPKQNHRSIGLDVTMKCQMPAEQVRDRFTEEPLAIVALMAEHWFQHSTALTFHDPLAAATLFKPDLCTYRLGHVVSDPITAVTSLSPGEGPDEVAEVVDREEFFTEFFSTF